MPKAWREFEELVAHIEHQLSPKGAVVTSPDRIRDKVTGRMREVDASIRFQVGSVPILITIECRRRSKTQDDTWIEQIATKREKIGAQQTIAVSSTKFSASAIATARQYGIELRCIDDITDRDISNWVDDITIDKIISRYAIADYSIIVEEDGAEFSSDIQDKLKLDLFETDIMFRCEDDAGISINALVKNAFRWQSEGHIEDNPEEQELIKDGVDTYGKRIDLNFAPNRFYTITRKGVANVLGVKVELRIKLERTRVPLSQVYSYSDLTHEISQVAVGTVIIGDDPTNEIRIFVQ